MMSPQLLERATQAFRNGYRDALRLEQPARVHVAGSFAERDYEDGYSAGFNELYWQAVAENRRRSI